MYECLRVLIFVMLCAEQLWLAEYFVSSEETLQTFSYNTRDIF